MTLAKAVTLAAVCTELSGEGAIALQRRETVPLRPAAVRVAVRAASVNFPDVLMIRGLYQTRLEPPFVPGTECAGVITEVGDDVSGLRVGDRVLTVSGSGAFATEVVVTPPLNQVHRIPDTMSWAEAASFNITYGTGIHGLLRRGGLRAGESVVVSRTTRRDEAPTWYSTPWGVPTCASPCAAWPGTVAIW